MGNHVGVVLAAKASTALREKEPYKEALLVRLGGRARKTTAPTVFSGVSRNLTVDQREDMTKR